MANKKRLIDANKLKWKLGQVTLYVKGLRFGKTVLSKILESYRRAVFEEIDEAPTVDAVEVVRFRDCKHWLKDVAGCTDFVGRCEFANYMVGATGYCTYGE